MMHRASRIESTPSCGKLSMGRRESPGLLLLSSCAAVFACIVAAQPHMEALPMPAPFSTGKPGAALPRGWEPVKLTERKRLTSYALVHDADAVVLHAKAVGAASGLAQFTIFDIRGAPVVEWRWKVSSMVEGADNRIGAKDDSPARLLFAFDGDKSRLPIVDRTIFFLAEKLSGRQLPYALLEYVWSAEIPVGTFLDHPHTRRVRMLVVASGPAGAGRWQTLSRNLLEDFRRAFHEEPGLLTGVGVLTDTDNTGGSVEAWYGDIRFRTAER